MRSQRNQIVGSGLQSRAYRCRLERLESRSMMAADSVAAAVDLLPEDPPEAIPFDGFGGDEWAVAALPTHELQPFDLGAPTDDFAPTLIDDPCLLVDDALLAVEPIDVGVQFVPSEPDVAFYRSFCGAGLPLPEESSDPWAPEFTDPADGEIDWSWDEPGDLSTPDWSWDWSWDCETSDAGLEEEIDEPLSWDETAVLYAVGGSGDDAPWRDASVRPLFYARGGGLADAEGLEFASFSTRSDGEPAPALRKHDTPTAARPRSVAFADMGTMAAAALVTQAHGSTPDAAPIGVRRRR